MKNKGILLYEKLFDIVNKLIPLLISLMIVFWLPISRKIIVTIARIIFHKDIYGYLFKMYYLVYPLKVTLFLIAIEICLVLLKYKGRKCIWFSLMLLACIANLLYIFPDNHFIGLEGVFDCGDLLNVIVVYGEIDFYNSNYPPLAALFYKVLYWSLPFDDLGKLKYINNIVLVFYILICSVLIYGISIYSLKNNRLISALIPFFCSPFIFALERGNIILLSLIFVMIFWNLKDSKNNVLKHIGLLSLAISANLKLYPAIYGLILLKQKRWKDATVCALEGVTLFLFPVLFFNYPLTAVWGMKNGLSSFVSAFNTQMTLSLNSIFESLGMGKILALLLIIVFVLVNVFLFWRTNSNEVETYILAVFCVAIPTVSFWYSAVFFIIPFLEIIDTNSKKCIDYIKTILYCFLFFPYFKVKCMNQYQIWPLVLLWGISVIEIMIPLIKKHKTHSRP